MVRRARVQTAFAQSPSRGSLGFGLSLSFTGLQSVNLNSNVADDDDDIAGDDYDASANDILLMMVTWKSLCVKYGCK